MDRIGIFPYLCSVSHNTKDREIFEALGTEKKKISDQTLLSEKYLDDTWNLH